MFNIRIFLIIITFLFLLLAIRIALFYQHKTVYQNGQKFEDTAFIASEPSITGKTQRFTIFSGGTNITIITGKSPELSYGRKILVKGKLQIKEKEGRVFYSLNYPVIDEITDTNPISVPALIVRRYAVSYVEKILAPLQSSLVLGIVLGIKKDIPYEFNTRLRSAGLTHVIAASGMNVSMVASALLFVLQSLTKRKIALTLTIFGVCFYVLVTGLQPSIIRAALMSSAALASAIAGRQKLPLYILFLAAFIMLFISPYWLFDLGFQLSFLATAGIITIKPLINILNNGKIGKLFNDDLSTTIAAQLATFPVLLGSFGSFNILSFLSNLLVLWTVPLIMILSGLGIAVGFIIPPLGQIMLYLSIPLLWYFEKIVSVFSQINLTLRLDTAPIAIWIGYYLVLISIFVYLYKYRRIHGI